MFKCHYNCVLGKLLLFSDGFFITGVEFENQLYFCKNFELYIENESLEIFLKTKKWLDDYFSGKVVSPNQLPIKAKGTDFQKAVWNILTEVGYGSTITYGEIAKIIAKKFNKNKMSAQAIGGAVGHNPITIIVPCHRVVGAGGKLVGYTGGIDKKIKLLTLEKINFKN